MQKLNILVFINERLFFMMLNQIEFFLLLEAKLVACFDTLFNCFQLYMTNI
jgi:hypothetical protein